MKKIVFVTAFFMQFSVVVYSQSSVSHNVKIVAHPILELKFDETINNTDFSFNSLSDYDNGKTNFQAAGLKVRSNKNWVLNVKSNSPNFTPSSTGDTDIKSSALLVRKTGTTMNYPLETFEQAIASGRNGGFDTNTILIDYIANPGYVKPDSYSIEITYTLSTP
ncbi:hypothetical protein EGI26_01225 [Lacihabitans sp. CCS-44]|uniref:hypothetical protein n=1 Tax=Lacihabitans sp. CCS-44 TaxID=2487331 RepID=UPI0020CBE6F5|nr:hypothetical protein [Lacihabitans sp. CCS-44]MCP9753785.1 hypothetical protein [Lacihabitans sp. CCS-44]